MLSAEHERKDVLLKSSLLNIARHNLRPPVTHSTVSIYFVVKNSCGIYMTNFSVAEKVTQSVESELLLFDIERIKMILINLWTRDNHC